MANPLAPVIAGNIIRVTLETITDGQRCLNTFDYTDNQIFAISQADLTAFGAAWINQEVGDIQSVLSPKTVLSQITLQELQHGTTPTVTLAFAGGTVGTAGTNNLPLEMGVTISRYGDWKGKHGRGRVTMPAIPDTFTTPATDSNKLNTTGLNAYNAIRAGLTAVIPIAFINYTPIISSRPVLPDTAVTRGIPYNVMVVRTTLGTARRRKPGRGI